MLFSALILSVITLVILLKVPRHNMPTIFACAVRLYTTLFTICIVSISSLLVYTHRIEVVTWLESKAFADEIMYAQQSNSKEGLTYSSLHKTPLLSAIQLEAPIIGQYPELPRGCEVTSLAMLLQYNDIKVSKMELADEIAKDPTPYQSNADGIYFGNPYKGFVGDMYTLDNPGYGVYHEPIADLARKYMGDHVHDFSGDSFSEILYHLNNERPVWVITNASYQKLGEDAFETWQTPDGEVDITMRLHSVLVTGYDEAFIYFNDPLTNTGKKAPITSFEEAWMQMGKQAITVIKP